MWTNFIIGLAVGAACAFVLYLWILLRLIVQVSVFMKILGASLEMAEPYETRSNED